MPGDAPAGGAGCPRHPGEKAVGKCSACGGGLCRLCRDAHGYFCSDACKQAVQGTSPLPSKAEAAEELKLAEFRVRLDRALRIVKRYVLPAAALLIALGIYRAVTNRSGETVWEFRPAEDRQLSKITRHGGTLYVGSDGGVLYALDAATGEVRWQYTGGKRLARARPLLAPRGKQKRGALVVITRDEGTMYAVAAATGKLRWKFPLPGEVDHDPVAGREVACLVADFYKDPPPGEKARLIGETYYSVTGPRSARDIRIRTGCAIVAIEIATGSELWRRDVEKGIVAGSLAVAGDRVYYSSYDLGEAGPGGNTGGKPPAQVVLALDHLTGKGRWKAAVARGGWASVTATAKGVLVSTGSRLYFISAEGKELWRGGRDGTGSRPVVSGNAVYCTRGGSLVCLELTTGRKRWSAKGVDTMSPPVAGRGLVFVSSFVEKKLETKGEKEPGEGGGGDGKRKSPGPGFPMYRAPGLEDIAEQFGALSRPDTRWVPTLHAIDAANGNTLWTAEKAGGSLLRTEAHLFAVDLYSGLGLPGSQTRTRVTALEPRTGEELWSVSLECEGRSWAADAERFYLYFSSGEASGGFSMMSRAPPPVRGNVIRAISIGR